MTTTTAIAIVIGAGALAYAILYFLMGYLEKPKHPALANKVNIYGGLISIVLLAGLFVYLFVISPTFVEKPYMEKPLLETENLQPGEAAIKEAHINYIVNEMGGYRLHDDPLTKTRPQFKVYLTDANKTYNIIVMDNKVYGADELAKPDAEIYLTQETAIFLFKSPNFRKELVSLVKQKRITSRITTDKTSLALKGYLALYNEMKG